MTSKRRHCEAGERLRFVLEYFFDQGIHAIVDVIPDDRLAMLVDLIPLPGVRDLRTLILAGPINSDPGRYRALTGVARRPRTPPLPFGALLSIYHALHKPLLSCPTRSNLAPSFRSSASPPLASASATTGKPRAAAAMRWWTACKHETSEALFLIQGR